MWRRELSLRMKDREQLRGYAGAICTQPFFSGYMVNSNTLETHRSSSGGQKQWLTIVSSHSGTGKICPLGVERPSNITQPFDLSTPTRPFPAVMDGFSCTVQVLWFIESCKYLLFFYLSRNPVHLYPHILQLSPLTCSYYQLASWQKKRGGIHPAVWDGYDNHDRVSPSLTSLHWGNFSLF